MLPRAALTLAFFVAVASIAWPGRGVDAQEAGTSGGRPNFIIIFADDLGYGDLGCYGHPTIGTPHLDRMAAEGMRFTQFYCADSVCTPSRAGLLTGRLPIRSGMYGDRRRVLFFDSPGGLPRSEQTIAEVLKKEGYATACVGKWHLGNKRAYLPRQHGFDSYFGLPYSNDMKPATLMRDDAVAEELVERGALTRQYTEAAVKFLNEHRGGPFFLYLAHNAPHTPLAASSRFQGKSLRGLYGDVVAELDWSVGQVLDTVTRLKLDERTLVFFTSDNGPWLMRGEDGGSAGLLRDGKGSTWEGGMRVPAIVRWPGKIPPGTVESELASTLDVFATLCSLAGIAVPARQLDSYDLAPLLLGHAPSPRHEMFFYRGSHLMAVRSGPWKAHFATQAAYGAGSQKPTELKRPLLYQIERDPSEQYDLAEKQPKVLEEIRAVVSRHRAELLAAPSQLDKPASDAKPDAQPTRN